MKVVLFCGGLGLRLHAITENVPKPLVCIGEKPLLWYLMKYYSYFGHKDFILCLGYKGEQIKKFFLNYDSNLSNSFIPSRENKKQQISNNIDVEDWRITFVDTGLNSNVGQRLKSVQKYVEGEEVFLANYSDGLTDLHLPDLIDFFFKHGKTGCFLAVKPFYVFHIVSTDTNACVKSLRSISQSDLRINGGFFVFKNRIFDYIEDGEDLVNEPFHRLIQKHELIAYNYDGFWASLDTFKDKQRLEEMASKGNGYWKIWEDKLQATEEREHA
jgi:glucose-1-phosphate cytidylyltransferase